jgi:hypothetical protein
MAKHNLWNQLFQHLFTEHQMFKVLMQIPMGLIPQCYHTINYITSVSQKQLFILNSIIL